MTLLICLLALVTVAGSFVYTVRSFDGLDHRATAFVAPSEPPAGLRNAAA